MNVDMQTLTLQAYAKVNLGLNIIAKRGDGYHEIDTLMARLDLHDDLTLTPKNTGITLNVTGADLPAGKDNLAFRAAELYLNALGRGGVSMTLHKRIPLAAGLGGGSADAAAVLRGLHTLFPSDIDVSELAKELGADVSFFVQNVRAARARGRGEKLEAIDVPELHLVLVNPGIHVSAKDAYENLQNFSARLRLETILERLTAGDNPGYINALQPGVMLLEPAIRDVIQALRAQNLQGVMMSGSGSTCFGLAANKTHAQNTAKQLQENHPNYWVRAARVL